MDETKLKLLSKPEEPAQEQPKFPALNVQVVQQGAVMTVYFDPATSFSRFLNEETMNALCKEWLLSRKQIKREMEMVQHINKTKNN